MATHKYGEINYKVGFTIDKNGLQDLKNQFKEIQNMTTSQYQLINPNAPKSLQEASKELMKIKQEASTVENAIVKAFNPNLNTLNITKFKQEMKGLNLNSLYNDFQKLGSAGVSAFRGVNTELITTNVRLKQSHKLLNEMAVTFKNTIRYGISSSVFNNFTNSVSQAFNYVKALDKSLNDIRIVTGQSADQMERFAKQANKAAQSLGASTLDYTKAALIYYQQGLDDTQVNERTDVTVKMANVLGTSAKEVSDYMTAIWNNFDDGSASLEHYADVITALGAATASSSEEIATGLEKFAAIANTVGLSYEYATSALATVVAQTRQSADTVGTAFKTLFARIQDLELGKTLDDGTTLGKYSEALNKVGINIKDQRGELKDMNTILDEMGEKWNTLSKSQQVALAQNVAGTRQYTQLVALMDNWGDFQGNLKVANESLGTLSQQQAIYLESTEAHLEKLGAATERFKSSLIDKTGINSLVDGLTHIVNLMANFNESLGGGTALLTTIGSVGLQVFSNQIGSSLNTAINNFEAATDEAVKFKQEMDHIQENKGKDAYQDVVLDKAYEMRQRLQERQPYMNPDDVAEAKKYIMEVEQEFDKLDNERQKYFTNVSEAITLSAKDFSDTLSRLVSENDLDNLFGNEGEVKNDNAAQEALINNLDAIQEAAGEAARKAQADLQELNFAFKEVNDLIINTDKALDNTKSVKKAEQEIEKLKAAFQELDEVIEDNLQNHKNLFSDAEIKQLKKYQREIKKHATDPIYNGKETKKSLSLGMFDDAGDAAKKATKRVQDASERIHKTFKDLEQDNTELTISTEQMTKIINKSDPAKAFNGLMDAADQLSQSQAVVKLVSGFGQLASSLQILSNIKNIWNNEDISLWEKTLQITTALGMGLGLLINSLKQVKESWVGTVSLVKELAAKYLIYKANVELTVAAKDKEAAADLKTAAAQEVENEAKEKEIELTLQEMALNGTLTAENLTLAGSFGTLAGAIWAAIAPLIPFIAAGAAIAAVTYAIVTAAKQEEALAEKVDQAKENAEKATSAYQELSSTISSYKDAKDGINKLTEGTLEFYEAIVKANAEAQKLIDSLGLVAGTDYTIGKGGLIEINQDSLENKQFQKMQEVYRAQAEVFQARLNLINYKQERQVKEFTDEVNKKTKDNISGLLSYSQGAQILKDGGLRQQDSSGKWNGIVNQSLGQLETNTNKIAETTGDVVDITENISHHMSEYKKLEAERISIEAQREMAVMQGYASKGQLAYINTLSEKTQKNTASMVQKVREADHSIPEQDQIHVGNGYSVGGYFKNFGNNLIKNFRGFGPVGLVTNLGQSIGEATWQTAQSGINEETLKRLYLENTNQYSIKDLDYYRDKDSKKYKEILGKVDLQEAETAYNNGFYDESSATDTVLKYIKQNANLGKDKTSSKYILDAITGFNAGTITEKDINNLTQDEREIVRSRLQGFTGYAEQATGETTTVQMNGQDVQVSSDLLNLLWTDVDRGSKSIERLKEEFADYNNTMKSAAEELGTTEAALKAYDTAMVNAAGGVQTFSQESAEAAVKEYKFNKAYNERRKTFEDNEDAFKKYVKALKNGEKVSYDVADGVGEILTSLEEMNIFLKASDLKDDNVITQINKLLKGTEKEAEEAYKALYDLSRKNALADFLNIDLNNDKFKSQVEEIEEILKGIDETEPGKNLEEKYAEKLRNMINDTGASIDEINKLAQQLGIEIPVDLNVPTDFDVQDNTFSTGAQSILHRYDGDVPDPKDPSKKVEVHYQWIETIEDKTEHFLVPKATNFKVNENKKNLSGSKNFKAASSGKKTGGGDNKPDKMDPVKTEIDRYHKVNTQISKVDNSLKKLQSQQEKFVGSKLINNLNAQWNELNTQINNYNEKLRIANEEQRELANTLSAKGVQFNADGTVANYAESIRAQESYVNSLIDKYNSMSKDQQEKYKDTVENAKKDFEEFQKNLDRYDEIVSDFIPDLQQSIQDAIDKQIELNVQKFNMEIEITLDMDQATRDWNAWVKRAIEGFDAENIFGNAQARLKDFYTYFNEAGTADAQVGTRHVNDILAELTKMDNGQNNIYGDNRKQALDDLRTYYTQLMQSITDVIELQDELHQDVLDEMDEVQEKFSKQVSSYQYLRDLINHDIKVIQMVVGEDGYGEMAKFYQMQQENYEKQLDFQRQQKDFWYAQMQAAEEGSKEWDSAREKWEEAVNEFNSILEEGLENARQKFENTINDIFKRLNNSITKGMGLDYVNSAWDLINQNADRYLDTINASYAIRQLEKKFTDDINKMDNTAAQQKLKKVMDEQLANLKERERITQYDVDRANKLYEIELAKIALEEAQQNKSQMRLRRDSQGNYTYQYTADKDAIGDAKDALNNAYNDLYNFDKERYNTVLSDIYDIWNNYQQQMAEAALINDPELRAEKEKLIQEQYNELMLQAEADYQVSKYNLDQSFFWDWVDLNKMTLEEFKGLTDSEKELIKEEMIPTYKNALSEMADAFAGENGFERVTLDAWNEIKEAENVYAADMQELETISGQTYETIINGEDEAIDKAQDLIKNNKDLIDAYEEELTAVQAVYEKVKQLRQEYEAAEKAAIAAAKAAYEYEHREQQKQQEAAKNQTQTTSSAGTSTNTSPAPAADTSAAGAGGSGSGGGNGTPEVGEVVTYQGGSYYADSYGGGGHGSKKAGTQVKITIVKNGRPYPIHIATTRGGALGWIRQDQIAGYDTGGYTGTWGNNGRLAMLHQKELVLNASDTENMLNTVAIMRNLAFSLGSSVLARLAGATATGIEDGNSQNGILEQQVHIDATFPNVHNAAEIEQALNNLVNAASQKVYEKR